MNESFIHLDKLQDLCGRVFAAANRWDLHRFPKNYGFDLPVFESRDRDGALWFGTSSQLLSVWPSILSKCLRSLKLSFHIEQKRYVNFIRNGFAAPFLEDDQHSPSFAYWCPFWVREEWSLIGTGLLPTIGPKQSTIYPSCASISFPFGQTTGINVTWNESTTFPFAPLIYPGIQHDQPQHTIVIDRFDQCRIERRVLPFGHMREVHIGTETDSDQLNNGGQIPGWDHAYTRQRAYAFDNVCHTISYYDFPALIVGRFVKFNDDKVPVQFHMFFANYDRTREGLIGVQQRLAPFLGILFVPGLVSLLSSILKGVAPDRAWKPTVV